MILNLKVSYVKMACHNMKRKLQTDLRAFIEPTGLESSSAINTNQSTCSKKISVFVEHKITSELFKQWSVEAQKLSNYSVSLNAEFDVGGDFVVADEKCSQESLLEWARTDHVLNIPILLPKWLTESFTQRTLLDPNPFKHPLSKCTSEIQLLDPSSPRTHNVHNSTTSDSESSDKHVKRKKSRAKSPSNKKSVDLSINQLQRQEGQTHNENAQITDLLERLQAVYENTGDRWRSIVYKKAAAVIKQLPLVTDSRQLIGVAGIGQSTRDKVAEILSTGRLSKLEELEEDPQAEVIQTFTNIFGVGEKTAHLLYAKGFRSLNDLRERGMGELTAQQRVGLDRYDDLLARVPREESEAIKAVVDKHIQQLVPGAESVICGSYLRGKEESGDVDLIVTAPADVEMLPDSFLSQLVINLKKEGFLTDHLAVPRGVDLNSGAMDRFVTRDPHGSSTSSHSSTSTKSTTETKGTSNYMGVCKLNDRPHRRHRRIDIKVYPRDQVPFAMLYFSGPDHFGRSIRQHAKLQGYKLNDKGLFPVTSEGVESGPSLPCKTERDIFAALGVEYCPPQERNLFENLTATLPVKEEQKG